MGASSTTPGITCRSWRARPQPARPKSNKVAVKVNLHFGLQSARLSTVGTISMSRLGVRPDLAHVNEAECRRSFARSGFLRFPASIRSRSQRPRDEAEKQAAVPAWITGRISFGKRVRVALPNGTIGLTFHGAGCRRARRGRRCANCAALMAEAPDRHAGGELAPDAGLHGAEERRRPRLTHGVC